MRSISLKLPEELISESDRFASIENLPRSEYIRRAIEQLNGANRSRLKSKRMAAASRRVRGQSMEINDEFAAIERDVDS